MKLNVLEMLARSPSRLWPKGLSFAGTLLKYLPAVTDWLLSTSTHCCVEVVHYRLPIMEQVAESFPLAEPPEIVLMYATIASMHPFMLSFDP